MTKFMDILEKCGDKNCKCKKGEKCNSPSCKCKDIKEGKSSSLCKQCGIKLSKLSKDEGFCVECATPINEGKYDNDDEYGDWKYHSKKDDGDLPTGGNSPKKRASKMCGTCGQYIFDKKATKCTNCKSTKPLKDLSESKFDKYLIETEEQQKILIERIEAILDANDDLFEDTAAIATTLGTGTSFVNKYAIGAKSDAEIILALYKNKDSFPPKVKTGIESLYSRYADQIKKIQAQQQQKSEFKNASSNVATKEQDPWAATYGK